MKPAILLSVVFATALAVADPALAGPFDTEYLALRKMVGREEYDASFERCKAMIVQYPREEVLYEALGEIAQYAGRTDDAMDFLWERVEVGTGLSLCYFGLGSLSYRRKDDRNAIMFLSKAIELGVEVPECYSFFVYAYERQEGIDATLKLLTSLCHRHPRRAFYWYGLALAYWSNANFSSLQECIDEAAELDPSEPTFKEVKAVIHLLTGGVGNSEAMIRVLANQSLQRSDMASHCFLLAQVVNASFRRSDLLSADSIANRLVRTAKYYGFRRWVGWGYQQAGEAAFLRGQYSMALTYLQHALNEAIRSGDHELAEVVLSCTFDVHTERGDWHAACSTAQRRLESESRFPRSRSFVRSMNDMASILNSIGMQELSLDFAVEALSIAEQLRLDGRVRCELNTTVGLIHLSLGDFRSALRHLRVADELVNGDPYYHKVKSVTSGNLGELELARGDYAAAERYFRVQSVSAQRGELTQQIAAASLNLGALNQARSRFSLALRHLRSAYNLSVRLELMPISIESIVRMARIHERLGEENQALSWYEVLDSLSTARRKEGWYWVDWSLDRWRARGVKDHAALLARRGLAIEAWMVGEAIARERSWPFVASLAASRAGPPFKGDCWEAQGILDYGQLLADQDPHKNAAPTDLHILMARSGIVAAELTRRARAAENSSRSAFFGCDLSPREFLERVRGVLGEKGALIQYFVGESNSLAVCVSQDTIFVGEIQLGEKGLREKMARMSPVFSSSGNASSIWNPTLADFDLKANASLRDSIWTPVMQAVGHPATVYVIPDGPLAQMPFEILVTGHAISPSGEVAGDTRFLVNSLVFSYHVSATALMASEQLGANPGELLVIGFGDPEFSLDRRTFESSAEKPSLPLVRPRLPQSRGEIEVMGEVYRESFGGKLGQEATEGSLKEAFSTSHVIHVAAHGFLDRNLPFLSRIRLAPDSLTGDDGSFHTFEFAGVLPPIPVLILSGCNTLAVSGVSNNFREGAEIRTAPAQVTIGSLWNVDDRIAATLMKKFHGHVAKGEPLPQALSSAKNELIREGMSDPFEWGAFILVGHIPARVKVMGGGNKDAKRELEVLVLLIPVLTLMMLFVSGRYVLVAGAFGRIVFKRPSSHRKGGRGKRQY